MTRHIQRSLWAPFPFPPADELCDEGPLKKQGVEGGGAWAEPASPYPMAPPVHVSIAGIVAWLAFALGRSVFGFDRPVAEVPPSPEGKRAAAGPPAPPTLIPYQPSGVFRGASPHSAAALVHPAVR